jgi:hypothetical protein
MSSVADALADLSTGLRAFGARWYLFGAQAAILHGAARLTADVDVTVLCEPGRVQELVEALAVVGIELRVADVDDFVARTRVLPMRHRATSLPVDVVLGGPGLDEEFARRAAVRRVGTADVPVVRAEDLVVAKIIAGRPRDLDDVGQVLTANLGRMDLDEIRATLEIVTDALREDDLVARFETVLASAARDR